MRDADPSSRAAPWRARAVRSLRGGALQALLVYTVLVAAFLVEPLRRYDEVHFSSADLTQAFSLTRVEPGHVAGNTLQSDAVTQMQPWLMFNRDELHAGRFPLWNRWNGAGAPHFANYQSAVLSPFSVPFYVLGFKAALLASAALKLLALCLFTYLFLRAVDLAHVPALVGGACFGFAGHNVLLLYFPHVGALCALPAGLWCVELVLARFRAGQSLVAPLCGVTAALLVGLLAGNPEPFYFASLVIGAWSAVRLAGTWQRVRQAPGSTAGSASRRVLHLALALALAAILAAGLAACQLLPFFEYLGESVLADQRASRQTPLDPAFWPLSLFPDALGNPASAYSVISEEVPPNYELVNAAYCGGLATLLAACTVLLVRRDRLARFFVVAGVLWLAYAYDLLGASDLFARIPTLGRAPMNRSQGIWNFLVACGAAVHLDRAARAQGSERLRMAAVIAVAALAWLVACLIGADRLMAAFAHAPSSSHAAFLDHVPGHVRFAGGTLLAGAACAALLWTARSERLRAALGLCVLALAFAQTGILLRRYNPVCEDRFFFPVTERVRALKEHVGDDRVAILGYDALPPDSNLAYRIATLASYDGMWVRDLDTLYRDRFGTLDNWRPILFADERALTLFGVDWVLAKWGWNAVDSLRSAARAGPRPELRRHDLRPGQDVVQTFTVDAAGLCTLMVVLSAPESDAGTGGVLVRLEDVAAETVVLERRLARAEVAARVVADGHVAWPSDPQLDPPGRPVALRFDPLPDSRGRTYRLSLSGDGNGGEALSAWSHTLAAFEGQLHDGGRPLEGELLFDASCACDRFVKVADVGEFELLRPVNARSRWWMVDEAVSAEDDRAALSLLRTRGFDPARSVVLEAAALAAHAGPAARRPRAVKFSDGVEVYLVGPDGRSLVHLVDEAAFAANGLSWKEVTVLPPAARAEHEIVPHDDAEELARRGIVLRAPAGAPTDAGTLALVRETPTRLAFEVDRTLPGWLVVSQTHYPGWVARVDGETVPLLRANLAFDAVALPAGRHAVEIAYEPRSLRLGVALSVASLACGAALALAAARRRARRDAQPSTA